jgi:NAD(P)-dependent dehydrogenase (short-subunit alcohol dehydrogenase family)
MATRETALIVGAGAGLSAALARLCAADGMNVALAARDACKLAALCTETGATAYTCNAADADAVARLFDAVESAQGFPDLVVYNASARVRGPIAELDPAAVAETLSVTAFGGFLVGQAAARGMVRRGSGTVLFTGASASIKGFARSAPFAMGKFALRGWPKAWRASCSRRISTLPISSSTAASPRPMTRAARNAVPTGCCNRRKSRRAIFRRIASIAAPGPSRSRCGRGRKNSRT